MSLGPEIKTYDDLVRAWRCEYCKHGGMCNDTPRDENCVYSAKPELIEEFELKQVKQVHDL